MNPLNALISHSICIALGAGGLYVFLFIIPSKDDKLEKRRSESSALVKEAKEIEKESKVFIKKTKKEIVAIEKKDWSYELKIKDAKTFEELAKYRGEYIVVLKGDKLVLIKKVKQLLDREDNLIKFNKETLKINKELLSDLTYAKKETLALKVGVGVGTALGVALGVTSGVYIERAMPSGRCR